MLALTRNTEEEINIYHGGEKCVMRLVWCTPTRARIAFDAPGSFIFIRAEIDNGDWRGGEQKRDESLDQNINTNKINTSAFAGEDLGETIDDKDLDDKEDADHLDQAEPGSAAREIG